MKSKKNEPELMEEKKIVCSYSLDPEIVKQVELHKPHDRSCSWYVNSILRGHFTGEHHPDVQYVGYSNTTPQHTGTIGINYVSKSQTMSERTIVNNLSDEDIKLLKRRLKTCGENE